MNPPPRNAEPTPQRRSLDRQLLFSHLSVAVIGLAMLCITLIATYDLRTRVILLANESGPLAQASFQVLAGVRHSLDSLRGWVSLGDPRFLDDWRAAWDEDIGPALGLLTACQNLLQQTCNPERLRELRALLADLQESQWWVQDVAHTPGNEPARVIYLLDIEPGAAELNSLIAALFQEEEEQSGSAERKTLLVQFAEIQKAFFTVHLLLRDVLGTSGLSYANRLQEPLDAIQSKLAQIAASPLPTAEQRRLLNLFQNELRAFTGFAQEVIRLRRSDGWNVALHRVAVETDPLANRVTTLAAEIATDSRARLEREAEAARAASAMMVWNLVVMILTMVVVAYGMSRKRARALAKPITALAEATRQLAAGRLHEDIPISGNDELAELTRSFNTMRASLQQAQAELRDVNALLEQRVSQRTTQLAAINHSLSREIAERNQADHALRESEARLRAMAQAIPDLVFVVDEDGRYREILAAGRDRAAIGSTSIRGNS